MLEQVFWHMCDPVRGSMLEQSIPEGLHPVGRTHAGAGEECEEEGLAETTCDELIATPFLKPLHCCGGGGRENGE